MGYSGQGTQGLIGHGGPYTRLKCYQGHSEVMVLWGTHIPLAFPSRAHSVSPQNPTSAVYTMLPPAEGAQPLTLPAAQVVPPHPHDGVATSALQHSRVASWIPVLAALAHDAHWQVAVGQPCGTVLGSVSQGTRPQGPWAGVGSRRSQRLRPKCAEQRRRVE